MTRSSLEKKRPPRSDRRSFWDGFFLFGFFDALGDLFGAIFDGLGSN